MPKLMKKDIRYGRRTDTNYRKAPLLEITKAKIYMYIFVRNF